jgi:hypothetical protein
MGKKYRILLEIEGKFYPLFMLGYINSGYFVECLIGHEDDEHLIAKMPVPKHMTPIFKIMASDCEYWSTRCRPKMTHHTSGDAQISKTGKIFSGFYKLINRAKGVHLKTMRLLVDSGTCFGYNIWGFEHFNAIQAKNGDIIIQEMIQGIPRNMPKKDRFCVHIQAYFLPKDYIKKNYYDEKNGVVSFCHINYGLIPLKCILSPQDCPGFIAFSCFREDKFPNNQPYGYAFTGATTYGPTNGPYTMFNIIFPFDKHIRAKSLDYAGWNMIKSMLDDFLYKMFHKFWQKDKKK